MKYIIENYKFDQVTVSIYRNKSKKKYAAKYEIYIQANNKKRFVFGVNDIQEIDIPCLYYSGYFDSEIQEICK